MELAHGAGRPLTAALAYIPYLSVGSGVLGFLGTGYMQEQGIAGGWGFALLRLWRGAVGEYPHDTASISPWPSG